MPVYIYIHIHKGEKASRLENPCAPKTGGTPSGGLRFQGLGFGIAYGDVRERKIERARGRQRK